MSRTRKSKKAPGTEYWSKRPRNMAVPSAQEKQLTHSIERAKSREEIFNEVHENEAHLLRRNKPPRT